MRCCEANTQEPSTCALNCKEISAHRDGSAVPAARQQKCLPRKVRASPGRFGAGASLCSPPCAPYFLQLSAHRDGSAVPAARQQRNRPRVLRFARQESDLGVTVGPVARRTVGCKGRSWLLRIEPAKPASFGATVPICHIRFPLKAPSGVQGKGTFSENRFICRESDPLRGSDPTLQGSTRGERSEAPALKHNGDGFCVVAKPTRKNRPPYADIV